MEKVDSLFYLVKSLSKSQKRYFKINSTHVLHGGNNYMKLFDLLDEQRYYDEDEVIERFKGENFVNHLPSEKNYLYELILKNMRSYNFDKNVATKLNGMILDISFLKDIRMVSQAYKKLRKAKRIAESNERWLELLQLLMLEKRMINRYYESAEERMEVLETIREAEKTATVNLQMEQAYESLEVEMWNLVHRYEEHKEEFGIEQVDAFMKNDLLSDESKAGTFVSRDIYFFCHAMNLHLRNQFNDALEWRGQRVELWRGRPEMVEEYPHFFKNILINFAGANVLAGKYKEFSPVLEEAKKVNSLNIRFEIVEFLRLFQTEFFYYHELGKFTDLKELMPKVEEKLIKYRYILDEATLINIYYRIALYYFHIKDAKELSKWASKVKRMKSDKIIDRQVFLMFMEIMAHFDDRQDTNVRYMMRKNFNFVKNVEKLSHFQMTLYKTLRKIVKSADRSYVLEQLFKLRSDVQLYEEARFDKIIIGLESTMLWIDGEIKERDLQDLYLEKIAEREEEIILQLFS